MRILVIEDDHNTATSIRQRLKQQGYAVDTADNGVDGEYLGDEQLYDLIVLDLGLPQRPGLQVLQNWRARGNKVPVLVLTARDAWHERVDGLKAGADDYLGKPFHPEELGARVNALLRRSHGEASSLLQLAGITLDQNTQHATAADGQHYALTATEYRLLHYFMLHPGVVLSKSRLTDHVYEEDADKDSNVIEVYVNRLRNKFGKQLFTTRRGQGYVFNESA